MMNHRRGPHHNICGTRCLPSLASKGAVGAAHRRSEAGYTLVALIALMSLLALIAMAAAPNLQQQAMREREKEAIFRGEQVADAIRDYYLYRASTSGGAGEQALPTSIDQLLEGVPIPGGSRKRQVLRVSAARDPLSHTGEWRTVRPRASELLDFQRAVMLYAGNTVPRPSNAQIAQLQQLMVPEITSVLDTGSARTAPGGQDSSSDSSGPFIGVSSHSRNNAVLYYYGIDRHDQWIFTPLFK